MNNSKVWLVIGAGDGLGAMAVKYLVAKKQIVLALIIHDGAIRSSYDQQSENLHTITIEAFSIEGIAKTLEEITSRFGWIDFIINNANYQLFNRLKYKACTQMKEEIPANVSATIGMIKTLLPYLNREPMGHIINIPPQFCLTALTDGFDTELLSLSMDLFLRNLHSELLNLNCRLSFLNPGERLQK
jgi:short-subunit dehydrogenase